MPTLERAMMIRAVFLYRGKPCQIAPFGMDGKVIAIVVRTIEGFDNDIVVHADENGAFPDIEYPKPH